MDEIRRLVERIEVALLVRDPGSSRAAEAYDGLRKQVIASSAERRAHLVQLAEMDAALRCTPDPEQLRQRLDDWLNQQGVRKVHEIDGNTELFEIAGTEGDQVVVDYPAYIDGQSKMVIKSGRARRVSTSTAQASVPPPPVDEASTPDATAAKTAAEPATPTTPATPVA